MNISTEILLPNYPFNDIHIYSSEYLAADMTMHRVTYLLLLLLVSGTQSLDEKRKPNVLGLTDNEATTITNPDIQPLQTFTTINTDKYVGDSEQENTSPLITLCRR